MKTDLDPIAVKSNKSRLIFGVIIVLVIIAGIFFAARKPFGFIGNSYVQVYALVDDKISQSAAVVINLPKGVSKEGAEKLVSFEPPLQGKWISDANLDNALAFVPDKPLEIGKRYTAKLAMEEGAISKDFIIDEDPKVLEVFPRPDSEANENSSVTIMFNRPMVPLTTLSQLEQKNIPIQIAPATEGKWKWISTRILQFVPKNQLAISAHYSVKILPGFLSTDGVPVPTAEFLFTTRPLRHESSTQGTILYDQPIDIRFNEPVNLERTSQEIVLKNSKTGGLAAFETDYGKRYQYDSKGKPTEVVVDRSVISIYPKADRNGRARIWDFSGAYTVSLQKAYPLNGDINFSGRIEISVNVTEAIKSFTAVSERTPIASTNLFDPQGKIVVGFYEDIDLGKSDVSAKGLAKISYGQKCKDNKTPFGYGTPSNDTCEKVDNKSEIVMAFNSGALARGESFPVTIKKLVNADGLTVNDEPLIRTVIVYPDLKILSMSPTNGESLANLTDLFICTNSPLLPKSKENFKEAIQSDNYLVFNRWENSYLRGPNIQGYSAPCKPGEYVNSIRYGLHPEQAYSVKLVLEDVFGQKINRAVKFITGKPLAFYSRFFTLQKIYNVTTPDKTKFTYGVENLPYVNLFICKVTPATMLSYLNSRPSATASDSTLDCIDTRTGTIDLPDTYWVNNYFQVDLKNYLNDPRGHYILSFSNPRYIESYNSRGDESKRQLYDRTYVGVTSLAVGEKKTQWSKYDDLASLTATSFNASGVFANLYWVSNASSLSPIANATVRVYQQPGDYNSPIAAGTSALTGLNGIAQIPLTKDIVGAVITSGDDSAIISSWTDNLQWAGSAMSNRMIYLYTDRPIYRPGQDVFMKGVYRFQFDGRYEIFKDKTIPITVYDAKNNSILNQIVSLSDFGTFVTHLKLGQDIPLGTYRIEAMNNSFYFDVAEYQGAAFETVVTADKEEYIAGDTAKILATGKYYFGVPLAGGTLQYSWTAQDYYFDRYVDEYFNFGRDWYYCQDCGYGDSYIGSGETTLDNVGTANVTESFDFAKLFKSDAGNRSKIVVFHGTIKDLNGKSVSFQKSFIVHRADFYLGVKTDPYFAGINENVTIRAKTVDDAGVPLAKDNLKLTASKVEWKSAKRQEVDGGFYSKYERVLTPVVNRNLNTNGKGDGFVTMSFKDPGEYQITLDSNDRSGNPVISDTSIYVYGSGTASVQPKNNETLDVTAEKKSLEVGEKAKIIIKSPYMQAKALITVERGGIFKYDIITIDKNFYEYEVPIEENYVPNVFVSVLLLSPNPEIKFGQVMFNVNTSRKALRVDVIPNKKSYLPGEKVTLSVRTTDYRGSPQSAEVSIAVADLSVLALKGNPKKNPLIFFYNGLPLTVATASNIKNILDEAEIPTGTKGGDGVNPADLARRKRGEFKDTAFWEGQVVTNENGMAQVSFTLPDNLTRWQVESLGITKDTKVGVDYKEITAAKKVMTIPLAPRFIIPGDEFSIGANVFNQTEDPQSLTVSLESSTLTLTSNSKQSVNLKPSESTTLYFNVAAPKNMETGIHTFTLSARNANFEDTVERTIPIKRNETYESTATAGSTKVDTATEYVFIPDGVLTDRGGVTVRAQASLAFFLTDAISYMAQFPYGCSEQMASKLDMLAVLKKANSLKAIGAQFPIPSIQFEGVSYTIDDAVTKGLSRMYENQTANGGFAYYQGLEPNVALSIHTLGVLLDLKEAGFTVSNDVISRAADYVGGALSKRGTFYYTQSPTEIDSLIVASLTLSRVSQISGAPVGFGQIINIIQNKVSPVYLSEKISSSALATLALLIPREPSLSSLNENVWKTLDNRIDIDSRGAYLKSNLKNIRWDYYETPVKNTALFLKAIATRGVENPQTDSMLRWLLASRDTQGAWGSTNTTLAVIDGVVSYLNWSKEGQSQFNLTLKLDTTSVAEHAFKGGKLFDTLEKFLSIDKFEQNKNHKLTFEKTNADGPAKFFYDIGLTYYLPVEQLPPRDEGISISRQYFALTDTKNEHPVTEGRVGDVLRGQIRVITPKPRPLFAVENFIPAGMELIDFNLQTEDATIINPEGGNFGKAMGYNGELRESPLTSSVSFVGNLMGAVGASYDSSLPQIYEEDLARKEQIQILPVDFKELHDNSLFLFTQNLPAGEYIYEYYARMTTAGQFRELPAVARELYFPEIFGRTEGAVFTVKQ
ncbi:MAG: alpha-2-macroglobulin family protein [bacterium]|nr:alpha-2-macroglobulin family protein [bacterium]